MAISQAILDIGYVLMALTVLVSAESLTSGAADLSRGQISESSSQRIENSLIVISDEGKFETELNMSGYEISTSGGEVLLRPAGSDSEGTEIEKFTDDVVSGPESFFDAQKLCIVENPDLTVAEGCP